MHITSVATLEYPPLNGSENADVHHAVDMLLRATAHDRRVDGVPNLETEDGELVAYFPER